jgi:hypothetical protein
VAAYFVVWIKKLLIVRKKIPALAAFDSAQKLQEFCQLGVVSIEFVRRFGILEDTVGEPERKGGQGNENKRGGADKRRLTALLRTSSRKSAKEPSFTRCLIHTVRPFKDIGRQRKRKKVAPQGH